MLAFRSTVVGDHKHTGGVMRLEAHSRIVGALALVVIAAALVPGTSAAYRLTKQEYARLIQASHQGAAPGTSARGSLTRQEIARLAQRSRQDPASVSEAPVVRSNPDQQVPQADPVAVTAGGQVQGSRYVGVNRAKEAQEAELAAARSRGVASGPAGTQTTPVQVPGRHGLAPRYPIAASAPSVKEPSDGFDYGDAAVGAGIAAAIVLLAAAAALTVHRRHQPQHS
jgi:hypothetical protein